MNYEVSAETLKFNAPTSISLVGPSACGKTSWAIRLLNNADKLFKQPVDRVLYFYSEYQPLYDQLPNHVELIKGLPSVDSLRLNPELHTLAIVDDQMVECEKSNVITLLATKVCHHSNVSLVYLTQNLFSRNSRTARVNMHYIVLFSNPADKRQISTLSSQMYPGKAGVLLEAFTDATKDSYGYLLVDMTQNCPDHLRLRTNVFPSENLVCYIPK